jgi:hypothetical protein
MEGWAAAQPYGDQHFGKPHLHEQRARPQLQHSVAQEEIERGATVGLAQNTTWELLLCC